MQSLSQSWPNDIKLWFKSLNIVVLVAVVESVGIGRCPCCIEAICDLSGSVTFVPAILLISSRTIVSRSAQ